MNTPQDYPGGGNPPGPYPYGRGRPPLGGLAGMFDTTGLPTELRVSYWIWLAGGVLGVLFGFLGFLAGLAAIAVAGVLGLLLFFLVAAGVALAAAQIILAVKMKEGRQWARLALSAIAALDVLLALLASGGDGGANWFGALVAATAAVLMWVPNSRAWFDRVAGRA
jgi:hypothetical protein